MQLIKSPLFWTLALAFVFNGLQAIKPELSGHAQSLVNDVLMVLGIFFHPNGSTPTGHSEA